MDLLYGSLYSIFIRTYPQQIIQVSVSGTWWHGPRTGDVQLCVEAYVSGKYDPDTWKVYRVKCRRCPSASEQVGVSPGV